MAMQELNNNEVQEVAGGFYFGTFDVTGWISYVNSLLMSYSSPIASVASLVQSVAPIASMIPGVPMISELHAKTEIGNSINIDSNPENSNLLAAKQ